MADYNSQYVQGQLQAERATQERANWGAYRCQLCRAEPTEAGGTFVVPSGRQESPDPNPRAPRLFYCTECLEQLTAVARGFESFDDLTEHYREDGYESGSSYGLFVASTCY